MTHSEIKQDGETRNIPGVTNKFLSKLPILVFFILLPFIARQFYFLSKDIIYGDGSIDKLIVQPQYEALRIPETPLAIKRDAVGRLAADTAQVYFPSQDLANLENAYDLEKTSDPWGRPSRYAPFVHVLCGVTICQLPYGYAAFAHITLQLLLFFLGFWVAFKELKITKYFPASFLVIMVCLFLSPAGLSWFERGQFSLYVALGYLWLFLGIVKEKKSYVIFAAFFSFIKWTSFPFLFLFFCVYFLTANDLKEFRKKMIFFVIFAVAMEVMFLLFLKTGIVFLAGLASQEIYAPAFGITLLKLFPRVIVKLLPLVLILTGYLMIGKHKKPMIQYTPFVCGAGIILLTYPTIAFEYNILCIFGLIPFVIHWSTLPREDRRFANLMLSSFFVFVICGSFSSVIFRSEIITIFFYILAFLICMLVSFLENRASNKPIAA